MKRILIALGRAAYVSIAVVVLLSSVLSIIWMFLQNPVWGILALGLGVFIYTFLYWLSEYKKS